MTDATTQLKIGAALDGSFETTTSTAKRKIEGIGTAAGEAGKKTGAIGDGIDGSAKKVESATKSMIASIQRQTAALEAGDKASRSYQESLAKQRGVSTDALKPYLDQLDAVKAKQEAAAKASESYATSINSVKVAALAAVAATGAMVVFAKSIIDAADGLNDLSQRVGISVKELGKYQLAAEQSGTSLDAISRGIKGLAKNMIENGAALRKAGIDATSADGAMQQLADIFKAMPDGIEKTTLAVQLFGKSGMDLIPMLNLGSEGMRDAAMASAEYAEQMSIMAPLADQLNDQMAEIALASKTAGAVMVNEFLPSLNQIAAALLGAETGANSFAKAFGASVNTVLQTAAVLASDVVFVFKGMGREIGGIIAQFSALGEGGGIFSAEGRRAWTVVGDAMKEDADRARKELDKWQSDLLNGVRQSNAAVQSEYNKRQGFGEKGSVGSALLASLGGSDSAAKKALAEANKELEKRAAILAELSGYTKDYEETQQRYAAMLKSGALTQDAYNRATQELVAKQPGMVALTKAQADAQKLLDKAYADTVKALEAYEKDQQKAIASAEDEVTKAQASYDAHGKLASVLQQETLARLENNRAIMAGAGEDLSVIDAQIRAKKELIQILRNGEARDAVEDLAKANQKAAEESSKYWEDALMRAFESGKGFFESLWSTIKNTLKTQVLKVLVTGSMTGVSALASAATGGASDSVLGYVNGASNLNTLYGAGSQLLFGGAAGASTASLVGANAVGAMGGDALGSLIALNGGWAGVATGTTAAGAAGTEALAGMSATGYGVIVAAAIAAIMYITSRGETRMGATYATGADGKAIKSEGPSGGEIAGDLSRSIFDSTQSSINATLKAVGSTATITGFTAGLESSENGKGFAFAGGMVNGVGVGEYKGRNGGQFSMSDMSPQQAMEAYVAQMNQVTLEALQAATDVPAIISNELKNIDIGKLTAAEVGELTKTVQTVIASVNVFNDSLKTLPFESLWDLSFKAAAGLVDAAGGFEKLNESLSGFYENFYSDAEQTANLTRVLGTGFKALGLSMPTDNLREWYRAQVESAMALDQSIPANQQYLASLLSIQSGVNTLATTAETAAQRIIDAAAKLEAEIVSAQESAMQDYMSAQLEYNSMIASEQESAAQSMQDAAEAIQAAMASAGQGIVQFIQSLLNTPTNAAANYRNDLALAQQGDVEASKRLPTSGRAYLDTQINSSATAYEAARATAKMVQELNALPAVKSYEQQLLEAVGGTTSAVGGTTDAIKNMNSKITAELSVTARSEILKLINFVANTDLLPDDLKELALSDAGKFSKTISFIQGSSLTAENMKLALMTETELVKTYNFVAGSELTEDQKKQAFGVLTKGDRTINVVAGSLLDADAKKQAFDAVGEVTRTVKIIAESNALAEYKKIALDVTADATKYIQLAATGFSSADAQVITAATAEVTKTVGVALGNSDEYGLAVALAQSGTIEKIMKASGGVLTLDQQMLLNGIEQYNKNIQIGVKIDDGELSEFQQTLMAIFGTMDITGLAAAGVDLSGVISQEALARLQSVNAYVQGFDWVNTDLSTRASQMHAVRTTAIAYGVSSQDVATALGVTRDTLASWYEALNVPFFARGSNFIPENTLAMVHEGERIIPAADNRELMSRLQDPQQNSEALVAEVRALRDDNAAQARAMVQLQQRLTKLMERWDSNGLPTERLET